MATKHSVDAPAPLAQYVPPAQAGIPCVAFVPATVERLEF
jgi:hypothetical protein